ncbi:MAG: DEAD/DEAH box helicase [Thermoguttaceae bacterium]|jgi:SNF2 family DNA or RNA helicase
MTGGQGIHWYPPQAPPAIRVDLPCGAAPLASALILDPPSWRVDLCTLPVEASPPKAIKVRILRPTFRVRSFLFSQPDEPPAPAGSDKDRPKNEFRISRTPLAPREEGHHAERDEYGSYLLGSAAGRWTRIRPPQDVIKLDDRLNYLLQPPLETLLADRSLGMPFAPFPFQLEGVAFLYPRHAAILADEMGLGKSMQAITTIRLLLCRGEVRTVLVVCPKPLVTTWQREFQAWAPEVPLLAIEGDQARRAWQWRLPQLAVRIANYELLVRDREILERLGDDAGRAPFDLVVLDESQRIKNRAGTTSEVVRAIGRRRSWALTGTPVENSAEDLVGIFEFLSPGFLAPEMTPRKMGRTVRDYVLRRTKEQVLAELPPKLFRDAELELTPQQRESYRLAEDEGVLRLTALGPAATISHVFELVIRLKQICNFDPATGASAKLERLEADLEEIAGSGRKAIVFSQWVGTLHRLAAALARFGPLEYHGKIPAAHREAVVSRFRDDPAAGVLLMSYGTGSVGLNLQFASYVFLFDRWWNPAVEDQAINRAHRIGTSGPVTVTRFLSLQTIEERIERILERKRELFETIFAGTDRPHKLGLTQDELFGLFHLEAAGRPVGG